MRIAVVNLTGGGLSGGYRKYLKNILPLMAKDQRVTRLDAFIPGTQVVIPENGLFTCHNIPVSNTIRRVTWLQNELRKYKFDVVFIPTASWLDCGNIPVVTMIRNMEPLVVPFSGNPIRACIKNIGRIIVARQSCKRANRVIAVSNYVKNYLVEKWNIKEHRIGVVYHGIDSNSHLSSNSSEDIIASIESFPFLFTAGSIRPARGLEDIIQAVAILNTEQPVQLVIAGNVDPGMERYLNKLKKMAKSLGITEHIHWLGKLNDSEMTWCYSRCEAFIMTSRVEACPNIVLEAMSHGCINIASENPPLPEFFGESAIYYPPRDATILAKHIQTVLSMGQAKKTAMSTTAKNIASRFSWEVCAYRTVNELQEALQ